MTSRSRPNKWNIGSLVLLAGILAVVGFGFFPIECPYCHNSDANVKGACIKRQRDGYCREDYYDTLQTQFLPLVSPQGPVDQTGCFFGLNDDG